MKRRKNSSRSIKSMPLSNYATIALLIVFSIWILLSAIDMLGYIYRAKFENLFYFRAWEKVSNYSGLNAENANFKPWSYYSGKLEGDLLNPAFLKSRRQVEKKQLFIVDEYGFRNPPHFLDKPIDAVVIGTSFVGGAALDQSELLSTILTNKYGIRTYNFTSSVQAVWEYPKFKENQPKFVIYQGNDADIISVNTWYTIVDRVPYFRSVAYTSFNDWEKQNEKGQTFAFDKFAEDVRNFSVIRVAVNNIYREIINFNRSWKDIVSSSIQDVVGYDAESDMLYFQPQYNDPMLGSSGKTTNDIQKAIAILNQTDEKLKTRSMELVIAAMPEKTYAEMKKYRFMPGSKSALAVYNKQAEEKGNYINVDMLKPLQNHFSNPNFHVYFQDDSHWDGEANIIAAKAIAEKICPELPVTHRCHEVLGNE